MQSLISPIFLLADNQWYPFFLQNFTFIENSRKFCFIKGVNGRKGKSDLDGRAWLSKITNSFKIQFTETSRKQWTRLYVSNFVAKNFKCALWCTNLEFSPFHHWKNIYVKFLFVSVFFAVYFYICAWSVLPVDPIETHWAPGKRVLAKMSSVIGGKMCHLGGKCVIGEKICYWGGGLSLQKHNDTFLSLKFPICLPIVNSRRFL